MRINKDNWIRFFDRKGFYIVLFLSVVVVAVTAVYFTSSNLKKLEEFRKAQQEEINSALDTNWDYEYEEKLAQAQEKENKKTESAEVMNQPTKDTISQESNSTKTATENKESKSLTRNKEVQNKKDSAVPVTTDVATSNTVVQKTSNSNLSSLTLLKPVEGDIVLEFAKDKLVFSKTLQEWTTHKGVDIGGKLGEPVLAAMEGIVTKVYKDPKLGNTVVIKNGKWETRYANLEDEILVKEGEKVIKGQQIGKIGESAKFEIAEGPHLHFELWENGVPVDPTGYCK
ncbi:MAG TPA: peptidoglycan DD-metalloendopeptidase family protein [Clostridia bacterium]|nr:peptidoglycan DD-metalloendopeptidase family protein [Clostridia bacterium]